jgi:Ca2+-transporting ATPase
VAEVPFDSNRKRMSTLHTLPDGTTGVLAFVKGAPDVILDLCSTMLHDGETVPLTDERRAEVLAANSAFASKALRVLAVAQRHFAEQPTEVSAESVEAELTFVGLIAMIDPARPEVKPAIAVARQAGIRTVMVTGDYPDTARAIGQEIGLLRPNGLVLPGTEIERMDDAQLDSLIDRVDVFARVSPNHKVRIVEAFQRREHIAAMTGDGVNDAPALKRADIGVAMGITGTDVSKEASDMILMDDNYATIVRAVEQGRIIYSNIRKFVSYLLTCNLAEISVILVATLLGWGSPLTAIQLLWLNLITDGAPALALGVEKGDPDTMRRLPRPVDEPIINYDMRIGMITQTIAKTVVTLLAFAIGRGDIAIEGIAPSAELATTMAFVTLAASELARAYTSRSELQSVFRIGVFSNPFMQLAVATSLIGLLLVIYVPFLQGAFDTSPLNLTEWLVMLPLIFIPAVVSELTKLYLRRLYTAQEKLIAQNFG